MNIYKFHTYRTDYYFPDYHKSNRFLFGLYHPYNRYPFRLFIVRIYWWLFKHCFILRRKFIVRNPDDEFPYSEILRMCPKGSTMSFNMGSPGIEQKISMLGHARDGGYFFAKYSTLPAAKELSRNEIKYLSILKDSGLVPRIIDYKDDEKYVFFRTECVEGSNPREASMNEAILNLTIEISRHNLRDGDLKVSLSHGDFTPWNVTISPDGEYKMIDWEMASERELGYDIFTYIIHVGSLLSPNLSFMQLINEDRKYINRYFAYFGISDWSLYLRAFAKRRIMYENNKNEVERAKKYECLL